MTQRDLAEAVGVSESAVGNWESGRSFPRRWQGKVEHVLGISLDDSGPAGPRYADPAEQRIYDAAAGQPEDVREGLVGVFRVLIARRSGGEGSA